MVEKVIRIMEEMIPYKPDIILIQVIFTRGRQKQHL